jgi:ubiquinone/menaquinone biosynthesis C-methylase UbiE
MTEDRIRAGYDAVAAEYDAQFADELDHKPLERALLRAFCDMAPPGTIADIGCGSGHITRYVAKLHDDVIGIDLCPKMIRIARRRGPQSYVVASMLNLPCPGEWCAGVVAMYSIIHLTAEQRSRAFAELARILLPEGLLPELHPGPPDGTVIAWRVGMTTNDRFRQVWPSSSIWPMPGWSRSGTGRF